MERSRLGCFTDGEEPRRRRGRGPLATILGVCLRLGPLRPALMVIPSLRLGRCVGGSCLAICYHISDLDVQWWPAPLRSFLVDLQCLVAWFPQSRNVVCLKLYFLGLENDIL